MQEPREYLENAITLPIQNGIQALENIQQEVETVGKSMPSTLQVFTGYLDSLTKLRERIQNISLNVSVENMTQFVCALQEEEYQEADELFMTKCDELTQRAQDIIEGIQNANKEHNRGVYGDVDNENSIFLELKQKHETLLGYSSMVTDLCTRYGITATDFAIDESTISPEQLNKLYTEYIKYLRSTKEAINPITILKERVPDPMIQGGIILGVIVACFLPILSILSIAFMFGTIYSIQTQSKKAKYYGVLQALLYNVNPDHLAHATVDTSLLLPETIDMATVDTSEYPELAAIEVELDAIEEEYDPEKTVKGKQLEYMNEFNMIIPEAHKLVTEGRKNFEQKKNYVLKLLDEVKRTAEAQYQKMKDEYVGFGDKFIDDGYFDTKLTLGFSNYIEEYVDIGNKNVIIRPGTDEALLNSFIKCLFVNAITHVNYMKMCVYVIDPNNMGQCIMPFYRSDLDKHLKIVQNNVGDILSKFTDIAQKNYELMQGLTIDEYNKKCQELNRDTIDYNLLLVLSQPKELEETEKLNALFQYSATSGIFIWMVSDTMPATDSTHLFIEPFAGVQHPIRFQDDRKWCAKVSENYLAAIDSYKPPSLAWPKFMTVACTPEQQWTFDADDNMYLYPGFQNGDPALCKSYPLGNGGNVHALGVGTTGAGKSIFIHHIIQTLCEMYSPRELQLWLCDFKGTEFKFYMSSNEFPYTLPHIKACLCTSDGDYATSVFHAVRVITDNRFEQMKNPNEHRDWLKYDDGESVPNFDNAKNWNRYWREKAKQTNDERYIDNCYPRVFLVSDEFQVIFQTASPKNLDAIKEDMTQISKLGRAANVHMFFTSQSMKGTLSGDILNQFSLRFALRCTADVSQDIMGTSYAAENLPKFGGLYVSATGIKKEDQPKFSTPFISTDQIHDSTKILAERAIKDNMPKNDLITYEEATKHPIAELEEFYKKLDKEGKLPDNGTLMVIGERMAYSENRAPDNFIVGKKNNENILACLSDYTDFVMFFKTIMMNINLNKTKATVIINSQVEDLSYIVDAESNITNPDLHGELLNKSCKEIQNWITNLIQSRAGSGKDSPIWIFLLGWDKGTGFGVDPDINIKSKINAALQQAGVYNIHIVLLNVGMVGVSPATVNGCKYRIAGKCSADDSSALIGTRQAGMAYEMKTGWVFVEREGAITRDKLYISEIEREIAASEVVL